MWNFASKFKILYFKEYYQKSEKTTHGMRKHLQIIGDKRILFRVCNNSHKLYNNKDK